MPPEKLMFLSSELVCVCVIYLLTVIARITKLYASQGRGGE